MLTRNSQVGEHYIMQPPQTDPAADVTDEDAKKAKNRHTCDMLIYDEESDRHVRVTWAAALENALHGYAGQDAADPADMPMVSTGGTAPMSFKNWRTKANAWKSFNEGGDGTYGKGDLDPAIRIVVARPFIEHLMHSVVMSVAGRETGATLFGPADSAPSAPALLPWIAPKRTGPHGGCAGIAAQCN